MFLFPAAVALRELGSVGLVGFLVFLVILFEGWAFVVLSGVLDWGTPQPRWLRLRRR